jgi:hypothetical protein
MVRDRAGELEAVLVLGTLGAPRRTALRGRRAKKVDEGEPEPVPTARATVVQPEEFDSREAADSWLDGLRKDKEAREGALAGAVAIVNRALHAHRVAAADHAVPEITPARALVIRLGYGRGETVADGRYAAALELPRHGLRTRRSMEAPEQRFAELLTGRADALPAEGLVLRARADLDAGRTREAALQARVGLESLLSGLPSQAPDREGLEEQRGPVAEAANAALTGELGEESAGALQAAVRQMEIALRRRRLRG